MKVLLVMIINEIYLIGKYFNLKNIDNFYRKFQVKKNDRKNLKTLNLILFIILIKENKF